MIRKSVILNLVIFGLCACAPTVRVAEPDLVMKSPLAPEDLGACMADQLGREFGDPNPEVENIDGVYRIAVSAPRGGLLGFAEVMARDDSGSRVLFYNGDLYWTDRQTSGVYPDIARDNWHRAERAFDTCQRSGAAG
jgi:hypothetical protein